MMSHQSMQMFLQRDDLNVHFFFIHKGDAVSFAKDQWERRGEREREKERRKAKLVTVHIDV
jgi:hypothetical protein